MDQPLVPSIPLRRFVDENWCVVEEAKDGPDPKLKIIDRPVEEGEEERNGSCNEEKNGASGYTVDEDDSEDDMKGWDDNGDPYLPFRYRLAVSCPEGQHYTVQEAEEIFDSACKRNDDLVSEWCDIVNSKTTPRPVFPLPVFPSVTPYCISGYKCYHVRYLTGNTSETAPEHPYFMPCEMMQVFSVGLSSHLTHPIDIYGWFSVRDDWEPLRNYLFKRPRDDPAMISKASHFCTCP